MKNNNNYKTAAFLNLGCKVNSYETESMKEMFKNAGYEIRQFNEVTKFDSDFDLVSGRYVIDAKSIMGIFSLDLSKPIDLNIHNDAQADNIVNALKPFIVE